MKPYKLASHKIWSVKPEERPEILKLDWNESTIPPSPKVAEYLNKILSEPSFFNLYPTTYNEKFLELLSDYTGLPQENLQYFASSDALHEYICKVFISVGDPVMILGPSYDNFRLTCQANGAEVYFSNYNDDFSFDAKRFEKNIDEFRCACGYFSEYDINTLDEIVPIINVKYQTMAYFGFEKSELQNFVLRNRIVGLDRIVPFGETTAFALKWDGYNLIETFSRIPSVL